VYDVPALLVKGAFKEKVGNCFMNAIVTHDTNLIFMHFNVPPRQHGIGVDNKVSFTYVANFLVVKPKLIDF
jgi:hypothetical protein